MKKVIEELRNFLETLKIHNKDLDICFNDALASLHIERLFFKVLSQQKEKIKKELYSWLSPNGFDNEKGKTVRDFLDKFYTAKLKQEVENGCK